MPRFDPLRESLVTTRAQREALWRLFQRDYDGTYEAPAMLWRRYRRFRRRWRWTGIGQDNYLFGNLWGMWIGIERDGYTHS
jgi:hypothetical protein